MAVLARIKILINAGEAVPGPKIAAVLGPRGIQMPVFCAHFNAETKGDDKKYKKGDSVTARIALLKDKKYELVVSDSPVSYLLKKAASIDKGATNPGKDVATSLPMSVVTEIAKRKMSDMNADSLEAATKMVMGTARSMGININE